MKKLYLCIALELCVLAMSQKTALDKSILNYIYRGYRNWLTHSHGTSVLLYFVIRLYAEISFSFG